MPPTLARPHHGTAAHVHASRPSVREYPAQIPPSHGPGPGPHNPPRQPTPSPPRRGLSPNFPKPQGTLSQNRPPSDRNIPADRTAQSARRIFPRGYKSAAAASAPKPSRFAPISAPPLQRSASLSPRTRRLGFSSRGGAMLVYQDLLTGACAALFLCPDLFFPFFFFPPSGAGLGLGEE